VLAEIDRAELDSNISVKPTGLGLQLDYDLCRRNLEKVVREAAERERAGWFGLAIWEVMRRNPDLRPQYLTPEHPVADSLLALLQCPNCRAALERGGPALRCRGCGAEFASEYGVPILYPSGPAAQDTAEDVVARLCGADRERRGVVERTMRRLRRHEAPPGLLRRGLWRLLPAG